MYHLENNKKKKKKRKKMRKSGDDNESPGEIAWCIINSDLLFDKVINHRLIQS